MDAENVKEVGQHVPAYLLVIVGEPFDEVQKRSIIGRIGTGLCRTHLFERLKFIQSYPRMLVTFHLFNIYRNSFWYWI